MNIGQGEIELDVHGCTWYQARAIIDSTLKRASKSTYRIRIIHGCNNGTRLRDMVRKYYANHAKVKRIELGLNPGQTDLILRELYG